MDIYFAIHWTRFDYNRKIYSSFISSSTAVVVIESCPKCQQEGQHPLTGQRAANFRRDLRRRRSLIDGYLESPFPTACLL